MLTALALAIVAQVPYLSDPCIVDLGKIQLGGREVQLKLPPAGKPQTWGDGVGEWKYNIATGQRALTDGGWGDTKFLWDRNREAALRAPIWKVRVFVFTRSEILEKSSDGLFRQRRSGLEKGQIEEIWESLARTKAFAEGWSGGRVQLSFQVSVDPDPVRTMVTREANGFETLAARPFNEDQVASRINGSLFDADDRVDRGPFKSVWIIHSGLTPPSSFTSRGTTIRSLSYFSHPYVDEAAGLSKAMYDSWLADLAVAAGNAGYPISEKVVVHDPLNLLTPGMWSAVLAKDPPADEVWRTRRFAKPDPAATEDLLLRLPVRAPEAGEVPVSLNMARDLETSGWGTPTAVSGPIVYFRPKATYVAQSQIPEMVQSVPMGFGLWTASGSGPIVIKEVGNYRWGYVRLAQYPDGVASDKPVLQAAIAVSVPDPLALRLITDTGIYEVGINESGWDAKERPARYKSILIPAGETAVQVQLDLTEIGFGTQFKKIYALELGPSRSSRSYERPRFGEVTYTVDNLDFLPSQGTSQIQGASAFVPPDDITAELQTLAASESPSTVRLLELLRSDREFVRLNVLAILRKVQDPTLVAAVTDQARSGNAAIADFAIQVVANQKTEEGAALLKRIVAIGPYDFNKQFAARELGALGDGNLAGLLSSLLTCRSAAARAQAAQSIASLPGEQAKIVLVALLQDSDPAITKIVTEKLDMSLELACRRALQGSVNDPSEEVRLASYLALLRSPIPEYRTEGLKGVRDESPWIRLGILQFMADQPDEANRPALRLAVVDTRAEIRAAALRGFLKLEKVEQKEIENTFRDADPRVQSALIDIGKKVALPPAALENLRSSIDPEIRARAANL